MWHLYMWVCQVQEAASSYSTSSSNCHFLKIITISLVALLRAILTPSDTNNGEGFSVPRFCVDSIFPQLNFNANPPVQNISIRDVHETKWEFWHIYRGMPRWHLLTRGWSKFFNQKKLYASDLVLFIKRNSGELFVGIRQARSIPSHSPIATHHSPAPRPVRAQPRCRLFQILQFVEAISLSLSLSLGFDFVDLKP
ncbi:hypothetical protein MRB53_013125 [Persea americana]|uniref:Uncharacterized protein n=1 Tax=Persea americana TaxID=3435 RepID=A0ACC2K760_PERAE|nr:hypothetical protein MRB53_013125 [Persea americana]